MSVLLHSLLQNLIAGFQLALFRPLSRADFRISAVDYAALAVFNLLVWLAGSWVRAGPDAEFVGSAVPGLLAYIPISLFFCLLAARALKDDSLLAAFAVLFASTDLLFEIVGTLIFLCLDREWLPLPAWGSLGLYSAYVLWGIACTLRALHVLAGLRAPRARAVGLLFAVMVLVLVYTPRDEPFAAPVVEEEEDEEAPSLLQEEVIQVQSRLLDRQLGELAPQRPGEPDLYFLGAAPYASQPTFALELGTVRALMDRDFDTAGRSLALVNHASTLMAAPLATSGNLRLALAGLGEAMNPDEDVLLLFLTTHGSADHELAFDFPPLQLRQVNPTALARMLADSGIKVKIVVIWACYSGGFIEALKDDNSLIITAADATHTSFGCEASSDFTWFSRALFDQALREEAARGGYSFVSAFERARALVAEREQAAGYQPSNPQLYLGAAMQDKLKTLQARLAVRAGAAR